MHLVSINPATGDLLATYPQHTEAQIELVLGGANHAFRAWRRLTLPERANAIVNVAATLRSRADDLARLAALEMGKPIRQAREEIAKCARCCDQQAALAPEVLGDQLVPLDNLSGLVAFEPLGVVLAIMPWNFPFWQAIRAAVPALLAGNAVVLKHSSNVTGCALALEECFRHAALPTGLFAALRVASSRLRPVIAHPAVRAVSLTGSTQAGNAVATLAAGALRKTVLELGGSDPYLVLDDADLALAARVCAEARLVNNGQSCIAAKRFIVVESVRQEFQDRLAQHLQAARVGDPLDDTTDVGPLARADLRVDLHAQVTRALGSGATCLLGGRLPVGPGFYYPPTLLSDVTPGMAVFDEETFGPVATVVSARDENDAIDLANRTTFGLGAAVFTARVDRALATVARRLEAGFVAVNAAVRSDPRLPFGGIKDSGYGRELGAYGLREFVNIKTLTAA